MNFKTDWSFLEKISMGAIGTKAVIDELNSHGHNVIELERYCTSNKIWSTKIKRLRMPDLLCLKCGKRIESRAKSTLEIKMSDNENNPDRRWNAGLREEDLVAFINCYKGENGWETQGIVNLFSVGGMEETEDKSKLGEAKSRSEGSEKDRKWPCFVPGKNGHIYDIVENDQKCQLKLAYDDGTETTYGLKTKTRQYEKYCKIGESFCANASILAGVLPNKVSLECAGEDYDFLEDIRSDIKEVRYAGVKALGFLVRTNEGVEALYEVARTEEDTRIRLEAYASLLRLNENTWNELQEYLAEIEEDEYKMEAALILGELNEYAEATDILKDMANNESYFDELRAAAVWSLGISDNTIDVVLDNCFNDIEIISNHAIALMENCMEEKYTSSIINRIKDDKTGAICLHLLTNSMKTDKSLVVERFNECEDSVRRRWLLLTIGLSGREAYAPYVDQNDTNYPVFEILWNYKQHSLTLECQSAVEFLKKQNLE